MAWTLGGLVLLSAGVVIGLLVLVEVAQVLFATLAILASLVNLSHAVSSSGDQAGGKEPAAMIQKQGRIPNKNSKRRAASRAPPRQEEKRRS